MQRLVIFGAGGFGNEVLASAKNNFASTDREIVLASDEGGAGIISANEIRGNDAVLIAVGDSTARAEIAARIPGEQVSFFASGVVTGHDVEIGRGAIFCPHSMVTCRARIGNHFHANIYSYVAHDCVIGDFVTFAPRVNCNGNVTIGDGAYIGTGACLKQGVNIGERAVIGMGAVVTKNVPPGETWVGNPARLLG